MTKKTALVTVSNPSFLAGTMVMLHSFRRHNPWFEGEILVIHDDLQESHQEYLRALDKVQFHKVGTDLAQRVEGLLPEYPDYARRKAQFYSLEMVRLSGYDQILFMDSDTLFLGSVETLFQREEDLLCCGTVRHYRQPASVGLDPFSVERFNAGVMRINGSLLGSSSFLTSLDMISVPFFRPFHDFAAREGIPRVGTDQIILNTLWRKQATFISGAFNYRPGIESEMRAKDGIEGSDATILHFTGAKKPWQQEAVIRHTLKRSNHAWMFVRWQEAFLALIESLGNKP